MTATAPLGLRIAALLAWIWGVVFLLSAMALGFPAVAQHGVFSRQAAFPAFIAILAFGLFFAGYGLPRKDRDASQTAVAIAVLSLLAPFMLRVPILYVGAVVNLAIL